MIRDIYRELDKEYERLRAALAERVETRREKALEKIPGLEALDERVAQLGISASRKILRDPSRASEIHQETAAAVDACGAERLRLLKDAGLPEDFLLPDPQCPLCHDTGILSGADGTGVRCTCFRQKLTNAILQNAGTRLDPQATFENFRLDFYPEEADQVRFGVAHPPRAVASAALKDARRFIGAFRETATQNLYLMGKTGVGKTFLSNALANAAAQAGFTVLFLSAPAMFELVSEHRFRAWKDDDYSDAAYRNLMDTDLLIIDDLGTETQTDTRFAEFFSLLESRSKQNQLRPCKTIITTNVELSQLYATYSERVASRILGEYKVIRLIGDDIRTLKRRLPR